MSKFIFLANFARVQQLVCDVIQAREGKFDTITGRLIKTGNGDIAYHFIIKDPHTHDSFKKGKFIFV